MNLTESQMIAFLSVTLLLTITPGVDTFLVIRNVIRGGKSDGVYTGVGVCSGLFVHATLSALGISVILIHSALLFSFIKLLGGIYLFWLGFVSLVGVWRTTPAVVATNGSSIIREKATFSRSFIEGLLSNILNPKPAVFYLAFFPQFISVGDPVFLKSLFLAGIQFIIGIAWISFLSITFSACSKIFRRPVMARLLKGMTGCVLIGFGIKLASTR